MFPRPRRPRATRGLGPRLLFASATALVSTHALAEPRPTPPSPAAAGPVASPASPERAAASPYLAHPRPPSAPPRSRYAAPIEPLPPSTDTQEVAGKPAAPSSNKRDIRGVFSGNLLGFALTSTDTQRAGRGAGQANTYGAAINYDAAGAIPPFGGSGRVHYRGALGGGSGGFDGTYDALVTLGPVVGTDVVGLAPRIGFGALIRGNERFYRSNLTLPRGDLALQIFPAKGVFLEGGITGAYSLVGRFNIEDTARKTGASWQAGAFGIVGLSILSASVQATREYVRSGPGTPIETLEVNGCVNPIAAFVLCANYANARGDGVVGGAPIRTGVQTLQLSFGLGIVRTS